MSSGCTDLAANDIRPKAKWRSRVPITQTSRFALIGGPSARDEDSTPRQENLTANRAGDRRSTAPPLEPLAYTINDATKVSGLGRSSIYKLIGSGELRSIVVAGRRLIPADALRELLQGAA
jgi:excisionase family DNA binding protein